MVAVADVLMAIADYLGAIGYRELSESKRSNWQDISKGTYAFRMNVPVTSQADRTINIPVDVVVRPKTGEKPLYYCSFRGLDNYLHPVKPLDSADYGRHWPSNNHIQSFPFYNPVDSLPHLFACGIELLEFHIPQSDNSNSPEGR